MCSSVCNVSKPNLAISRDGSIKMPTIQVGSRPLDRVATAQGIWLLTFPDGENTGNLVNLIFYTGKIVPTQGKILKI